MFYFNKGIICKNIFGLMSFSYFTSSETSQILLIWVSIYSLPTILFLVFYNTQFYVHGKHNKMI